MKFMHFGVATESIERIMPLYEKIGFVADRDCIKDDNRNINIQFMSNEGVQIELIERASNEIDSPVDKYLKRGNKTAIYHSCYSVEDIYKAIDELKKYNFIVIDEPRPAIAFNNRKVCFLFNYIIGMIELCEAEL